ncbi:TniQ family protein [Micromonospora inyonensis]|uniref:TniQ protein n=1 Tax=Micromonospora inyonensis TaxID=47866 RepID=A0A1C6RL03_9ACTN|nr:TniQ family protein [Micromonospora inyonensis]SCL17840.1 TniQ protein [Micromonospora inyonensis]
MTSPDNADILADRPQPLPVIPRPQRDETVGSYVRRLAHANHLRPSYLRQYLCAPPGYQGSVRAARLAVVTNRTVDALTRHFTTLQTEARPHRLHPKPNAPTPPEPQPDEPPRRPRSIANLVKKRGQKGARELLDAIRHEAKTNPSLRSITRKFRVQADTVLLALTTDPNPPSFRRTPPRRNRIFDPYAHIIDDLLAQDPPISRWAIWEHLVDEHGAELSYGSVRDYIVGKVRDQTVPRSRPTEKTSPKRPHGSSQLRKPDHPLSQSN